MLHWPPHPRLQPCLYSPDLTTTLRISQALYLPLLKVDLLGLIGVKQQAHSPIHKQAWPFIPGALSLFKIPINHPSVLLSESLLPGEDGSRQLSNLFGGKTGKQVQGCTRTVSCHSMREYTHKRTFPIQSSLMRLASPTSCKAAT